VRLGQRHRYANGGFNLEIAAFDKEGAHQSQQIGPSRHVLSVDRRMLFPDFGAGLVQLLHSQHIFSVFKLNILKG
jgi:hypothetical protein